MLTVFDPKGVPIAIIEIREIVVRHLTGDEVADAWAYDVAVTGQALKDGTEVLIGALTKPEGGFKLHHRRNILRALRDAGLGFKTARWTQRTVVNGKVKEIKKKYWLSKVR